MKSLSLMSLLSLSLTLGAATVVLSHVGHGDEFQATGGIERVEVNPENDQVLGIMVTPIEQTSTNGVMIPVTALVEADGKQLVFVKYENFYEPVEVTTGETQGDLMEVTEGLSVGEQLVTQGSLSLYAESRKTKTAETEATSEPMMTPETTSKSEDAENAVKASESATAETSGGFPMMTVAAIGGGVVVLVGGALAVMGSGGKKKNS
ncbi:cobalt transporter [Crocosphaera subtropica]|nr:cobalt transporter [Crocosphaera subtropica]